MDVEKLIHEVYAKQPIWDLKNALHHNRDLIYKYWKEIAKNCNTSSKSLIFGIIKYILKKITPTYI